MRPDYNPNNPFVRNFGEVDAYLVGLVMADGCITFNNGCYKMQLALNIKDRDIIDKLYNHYKVGSVNTYRQKRGFKESEVIKWVVYDHNLVHGLMYFEIEPRKTNLEVVPSIPYELYPHFLRGFFDGDGYVHCSYNERLRRNVHKIGFAVSYEMGQDINKLFESNLGITPKKIRKNGKSEVNYMLEYSGASDLEKIYEYFYTNPLIYLDRKYEIFTKLYNGLKEKGGKHHGRIY